CSLRSEPFDLCLQIRKVGSELSQLLGVAISADELEDPMALLVDARRGYAEAASRRSGGIQYPAFETLANGALRYPEPTRCLGNGVRRHPTVVRAILVHM